MKTLKIYILILFIATAFCCGCNDDKSHSSSDKNKNNGKGVDNDGNSNNNSPSNENKDDGNNDEDINTDKDDENDNDPDGVDDIDDNKESEEENIRNVMLRKHNELRRSENSKNMNEMVWDDNLAYLAKLWGEQCIWKHGRFLDRPEGAEFRKRGIGENLFLKTGKSLNPASPVQAWYNEKQHYIFNSKKCKPGKVCGHYTQVVWAKSVKVGCAAVHCPSILLPKSNKSWKDATFVVCYYYPPGNYRGEVPYSKGEACSNCPNDRKMCRKSLCSSCVAGDADCECKTKCKNCGTKTADCSCQCKPGTMGADCSEICKDKHHYCGRSPGWPKWTCQHKSFGHVVRGRCPKLCGSCIPSPDGSLPKC